MIISSWTDCWNNVYF